MSATAEEEASFRAPLRVILKSYGPTAEPGPHEKIYNAALAHGLPRVIGWYEYDFERHEFTLGAIETRQQ